MKMAEPTRTNINLHQKTRILEIDFDNDRNFKYTAEYLRVYSPSAEVAGHGPGQETLQVGKSGVNIKAIEPVGMYAVKLVFDDGHDSGLYTWQYLYKLGENRDAKWARYLERLKEAGHKHAELK